MTLQSIIIQFEDLLYPPKRCCICCGLDLPDTSADGLLCLSCETALDKLHEEQERLEENGFYDLPEGGLLYLHSAFPYRAEAKKLIHLLKFDFLRSAAVPLVRAMKMLPSGEEELIVPIPTTRRRERERGFNQAAVLAEALAKIYGMKCYSRTLIRTDDSQPQTRVTKEARAENVSWTMKAQVNVQGRKILLIDDVYTTGATAHEAVRVLFEAGCASIGMWTACRAGWQARADFRVPFL